MLSLFTFLSHGQLFCHANSSEFKEFLVKLKAVLAIFTSLIAPTFKERTPLLASVLEVKPLIESLNNNYSFIALWLYFLHLQFSLIMYFVYDYASVSYMLRLVS